MVYVSSLSALVGGETAERVLDDSATALLPLPFMSGYGASKRVSELLVSLSSFSVAFLFFSFLFPLWSVCLESSVFFVCLLISHAFFRHKVGKFTMRLKSVAIFRPGTIGGSTELVINARVCTLTTTSRQTGRQAD